MSESKASVTWQENKAFMGVSPSGHNVQIDADKEKGSSPMELILLGLGGCASYDVVSILQKHWQGLIAVLLRRIGSRCHACGVLQKITRMRIISDPKAASYFCHY